MKKIVLKPVEELVENDFIAHPAWASFYEPDDLETIASMGFDMEQVEEALRAVDYSDSYVFPLPAMADLKHLYASATFVTPNGQTLVGYVHGPAFAVYRAGKHYMFNRGLREFWVDTAKELAAALGEPCAFPLTCTVGADPRLVLEDVR